MKIDSQTLWKDTPSTSTPHQEQADFKHWLDEGCQLNPTKQSSGDEYYRQHQSQLQQSSLQFDAKNNESTCTKAVLLNYEEFSEHAKKEPDLDFAEHVYESKNMGSQPSKCSYTFNPLLESTIVEFELAMENSPLFNTIATKSKPESNKAPKVLNPLVVTQKITFKNNHLFIQGNQAELSLNLSPFNQQEQRQIIATIQEHLKKKHLNIRHLIINGVKND